MKELRLDFPDLKPRREWTTSHLLDRELVNNLSEMYEDGVSNLLLKAEDLATVVTELENPMPTTWLNRRGTFGVLRFLLCEGSWDVKRFLDEKVREWNGL